MGTGVSGIRGEVVGECESMIIMTEIWVRVRFLQEMVNEMITVHAPGIYCNAYYSVNN